MQNQAWSYPCIAFVSVIRILRIDNVITEGEHSTWFVLERVCFVRVDGV
jgi:hypothetical protein